MIINMRDVGFGEAILLNQCQNQDKYQLLVDCGTTGSARRIASGAVEELLDANHKEALVTHLHGDHINGFIELSKCTMFHHFYLPLYTYLKEGRPEFGYKGKTLYNTITFLAYKTIIGGTGRKKLWVINEFMISLSKGLVRDIKTDVTCVGDGDRISCGGKEFEVLWPESEFLASCDIDFDCEAEIAKILSQYIDSTSIKIFREAVEKYRNAFLEIYNIFADRNNRISEEDITEKFEKLSEAMKELNEHHKYIKLSKSHARRWSYIGSRVIKNMNDCSVVMNCGKELLTLGDIGKDIFEEYIIKKIDAESLYKVVKISHHGTYGSGRGKRGREIHYSTKIPTATYYLVSNSGNYNIKTWEIYREYPEKYPDKMKCTNTVTARCEHAKICPNCRVGETEGHQEIDLDKI